MKRMVTAVLGATLALVSGASAGQIAINWVDSASYADATARDSLLEKDRLSVLRDLERFLVREAQQRLPEGYLLEVDVTELDLEGEFEPWHSRLQDVRILRSVYPARVEFSYRLTDAEGEVVRTGEERLRNDLFLRPIGFFTSDSYVYTKSLLRDWLRDLKP